jgi:hypothetical protein
VPQTKKYGCARAEGSFLAAPYKQDALSDFVG